MVQIPRGKDDSHNAKPFQCTQFLVTLSNSDFDLQSELLHLAALLPTHRGCTLEIHHSLPSTTTTLFTNAL